MQAKEGVRERDGDSATGGEGKWKSNLCSEVENALIRETEVCVGDLDRSLHVHFCKVIVEQDSKRELEVRGSDGGAA